MGASVGHVALHAPHSDHSENPPSTVTTHGCVLHTCESVNTGQGVPPNWGGTQVRVRVWLPLPHVKVQSENADHSDTLALIGCGGTSQRLPE